MNKRESPVYKMDIADARISWAASFLVDWLLPWLQDGHIENPNDIVKLREEFPPISVENDWGIDFTINDVLEAALRWRRHNQQRFPHIPEDELPSGKEFRQAIDLLTALVYKSDNPETPSQTTFLTD